LNADRGASWHAALAGALSAPGDTYHDCGSWLPEPPISSVVVASDGPPHEEGVARLLLPKYWHQQLAPRPNFGFWVHHEALCFGGTIARRDGLWHHGGQLVTDSQGRIVPTSYGIMDGNPTLAADLVGPDHSLSRELPTERWSGVHYFLGSLHRHFGHVVLEGLSRLWLHASGAVTAPDVYFLVYEESIKSYALELLDAFGVPSERIRTIPRAGVRVEALIAPEPGLVTHRQVSAAQQFTYAKVTGRLSESAGGQKAYFSRRYVPERPLENIDRVEDLFKAHGFEIVHPEKLSIAEQIRVAKEATAIAGPVGSQMYLAAFQPPSKKTYVFAPCNFCLKDDLLLAMAGNRQLRMATGGPVNLALAKEERSWSVSEQALQTLLEE
jgi:hypothetical protein